MAAAAAAPCLALLKGHCSRTSQARPCFPSTWGGGNRVHVMYVVCDTGETISRKG